MREHHQHHAARRLLRRALGAGAVTLLAGPLATSALAGTPPTTPGVDTATAVSDVGDTYIVVRWTASTDNSGTGLKSYVVKYEDQKYEVPATTTRCTLQGLGSSSDYDVYVNAVDRTGTASGQQLLSYTTTNPGSGRTTDVAPCSDPEPTTDTSSDSGTSGSSEGESSSSSESSGSSGSSSSSESSSSSGASSSGSSGSSSSSSSSGTSGSSSSTSLSASSSNASNSTADSTTADTTLPLATIAATGKLASTTKVSKAGGFALTLVCQEGARCGATIKVTANVKVARSGKTRKRVVALAVRTVSADAGTRRVIIALSSNGREVLRKAGGKLRASIAIRSKVNGQTVVKHAATTLRSAA
ncbi:MAG: fibronectin type III domain-containing protein [Patulibacter sp.]